MLWLVATPVKSFWRSKLKHTASASKSVPSWKVTPSLRVNVYESPSSDCVPALREQRCGIGGAGLDADEALEDLPRDAERLAVAREGGVEAREVARGSEDERAVDVGAVLVVAAVVALARAGGEHDGADGDRGSAGEPALSRCVEHLLCTFHREASAVRGCARWLAGE